MRFVFALALAVVLVRAGPVWAQRRVIFITPAPAIGLYAAPYAVQYYAPALVYQPTAAAMPRAQDDLSLAVARLRREMTLLSATVSTHTEILNAHAEILRRLPAPPK